MQYDQLCSKSPSSESWTGDVCSTRSSQYELITASRRRISGPVGVWTKDPIHHNIPIPRVTRSNPTLSDQHVNAPLESTVNKLSAAAPTIDTIDPTRNFRTRFISFLFGKKLFHCIWGTAGPVAFARTSSQLNAVSTRGNLKAAPVVAKPPMQCGGQSGNRFRGTLENIYLAAHLKIFMGGKKEASSHLAHHCQSWN